ncbi:hypothetical protein [Haloarchaeobius sp. DT45]|uniref:hypothetical protein n=1 Tax=Haloarchaeobius sp. DT45 TaxID=3446116 RepID=UPI003F6D2A23
MPSRRRVLQTAGTALAGAAAGCVSDSGDPVPGTDQPTDDSTDPSTTDGSPHLAATTVRPETVPSGATVLVQSEALLNLVHEAAVADERVDLDWNEADDSDEPLPLGGFEYVQFDGETYDPNAKFVPFAGEASYQYRPTKVTENEVDEADGVVSVANLTGKEKDIAEQLVSGQPYSVGMHEKKPSAAYTFERNQYVRSGNETYSISVLVGDSAPHHMLRLDSADPPSDAKVVTVADDYVPESLQGSVSAAGEDGTAELTPSVADEFTSLLDGIDYVVTVGAVAELAVVGTA